MVGALQFRSKGKTGLFQWLDLQFETTQIFI